MFTLEEATVFDMQAALNSGEITSRELVFSYLERIAKYDKSNAMINSISEINPDAILIAEAMDRERKNGKVRSPLHGIPIVLKENINTKDKMSTSAGSIGLMDNYADFDATVVKKIRDAGLVLLGKANMTELANFMSFTMKSGYSSKGGQVINPFKNGAEVWGSSTGSAVAVSANFSALAIGTETDGSISSPSYINGCVGIKPTFGLVSRHGVVPIANAQDTLGPMARTVGDAASLLNVMVGYDEEDPSTWERDFTINYTDFLDKDGLKGLNIGINREIWKKEFLGFDDELESLSEDVFKLLNTFGATTSDISLPEADITHAVLIYEFKQCLNAYLARTNPSVKNRSLKDLIDFYGDHPKEGLKYGMSILTKVQYETSGTLTEPEYLSERMSALKNTQQEIDQVLDENKLDLIVYPGFSNLPPTSGYPSITVPAGYRKDGTPFGITFMGKALSEPTLIKAAYSFEQQANLRKKPIFK